MKLFTTIALFALMATFVNAKAQEPQPERNIWQALLTLGIACEEAGYEFKRVPNHQLGPGPQWKCFLEKRPEQ